MDLLNLPKVTKNITDHAGIFSVEQVESLSRVFVTHEHNTTEQVLTVLIPHRQGHELIDIGLKLFNENGIGQKDLNNGLLLIISTEEKKLRIITGKGMEIKYSEMICREIIEKHLRPLLNEGKYEELVRKWGEIVRGEVKIVTLINISTDKQIKRNGFTYYLLSILLSLGLISCLIFIYKNGILDFLLSLGALLYISSFLVKK